MTMNTTSGNDSNEFQFADRSLINQYEEDFMMIKNDINMENYMKDRNKIIAELEENGIISVFTARKNGYIFYENGLTSEEAATNAKLASEAYMAIQSAALYNLSDSNQAFEWISNLTQYLNNADLNIESYINMGAPKIKNAIDEILEIVEENGYDKVISAPATAEEVAHNRITNSYNKIKLEIKENPTSLNISKELDNLSAIINNENLINKAKNITNYSELTTSIENIRTSIVKNGANNTILNILKSNGYDVSKTTIVKNEDTQNIGMTDEQYEHNVIHNMYQEIKDYGFIVSDFYKQMKQHENQVTDVMTTEEMETYIRRMEKRTNEATFSSDNDNTLGMDDIDKITKPSRFVLSSFIEKIVNKFNKNNKKEEDLLSDNEKRVKQVLIDLENANYDNFAYELRSLKKYINNPDNPLNLSDGTNIIETIINKAESLGFTNKSAKEIIKENPNINETLVYYSKNQVEDLLVYGCFLTSKCNDVIKEKSKINQNATEIKENDDKKLPSVVTPFGKELPSVRVDISDIIKKVIEPGVSQTNDEKNVIQQMMDLKGNNNQQKIEEINQKVKKLQPSKTQEIIKNTWDSFISQQNNKKPNINQFNSIIDELVLRNNEIIEKTGLEKGSRIVDIHDELAALNEELINLEANKPSLENGLSIMEIMTKSDKKDNANYEEFYQNITSQKQQEIDKLTKDTMALISEYKKTKPTVIANFMESFKQHATARKNIKNSETPDNNLLNQEINLANEYLKVKDYITQIEKSDHKTSTVGAKQNNTEQQQLVNEMSSFVNAIVLDDVHTEEDIKNLLAVTELMKNKVQISMNQSEIQAKKIELAQIQTYNPNNNNSINIVKQKIKALETEEKMLSFNPETAKDELISMIGAAKSKEEVTAKLDSLIEPVKEYNIAKMATLNTEIEQLKNKIADNSNYLDNEKIELEQNKRDNIGSMIQEKDAQLEALKQELQSNRELALLSIQKTILEKQLKGYEEEKQILLQWNIEESESDLDTRKALDELFAESKVNLSTVEKELIECNIKITKNESKIDLSLEEINNQIKALEKEKEELNNEYSAITKSLADKNNLKYINKEQKLTDIQKLNKYKVELNKLNPENLDNLKQQFLEKYNQELLNPTSETYTLPGKLANGDELKSDGTITKNNAQLPGKLSAGNELKSDGSITEKPLELPGELENGDQLKSDGTIVNKDDLDDEEIEEITDANPGLLKKAANAIKNGGKKAIEWVKKHPKLAATIGTAVVVVVVGATAIIKSLTGQNLESVPPEVPIIPDNNIEQEANLDDTAKTETEAIADEAIQETEDTNSFDENYNSAINNILEGKSNVYVSADRAINNQEAVQNIYNPSFETSQISKLYTMEDGQLQTVSYDDAKQIVENGGTVRAQITNDGVGIGYVSIGDNVNEQNVGGMSR